MKETKKLSDSIKYKMLFHMDYAFNRPLYLFLKYNLKLNELERMSVCFSSNTLDKINISDEIMKLVIMELKR